MYARLLAGALSVSVTLGGLAVPALAQQPSPAPSVAPVAGSAAVVPPPPVPVILPVVPNVGSGYAPAANPPLPTTDLVGVNQEPFVGIQLQDAIAMALGRNTNLAVAESNNRIASYEIIAAKGAYDTQFQLTPNYQHGVTPAESLFQTGPAGGPITQISRGATAGFSGLTPFGTRYSIGSTVQTINNDTAFNGYNPFYNTAIALNLAQPLLRGTGGGNPAHRQLILATEQAQEESAMLLTQASQTITDVSDTYWDLVAAWRDVGIQEQGLLNAQSQAQSNQRLAQRGAAAPVDVIESNTQINIFQDNVFAALQRVQSLQTQLKSEIVANPADPLWVANLVPTSPVLQLPSEPKLDELVTSALRNRPEVAQLRAERIVAAANLAYGKNQLLPQVDLGVGVTASGFAGVPQPLGNTGFISTTFAQISTINALVNAFNATAPPDQQIPLVVPNFGSAPPYQTGKLGQSWTNLFDFRFPNYTVSLTLQFPLQNRTAKADYAIAKEQANQIAVQELALLQRIRAESVNAIQSLRETQYRLAAATAARVASEQVLASESRRFAAGTSTTFLVLQRQLDLANTRERELQAQTALDKAVVGLNQVAGTNFATFNIDVNELGNKTLNAVMPARSVILPLPPDAQVSPPPPHR